MSAESSYEQITVPSTNPFEPASNEASISDLYADITPQEAIDMIWLSAANELRNLKVRRIMRGLASMNVAAIEWLNTGSSTDAIEKEAWEECIIWSNKKTPVDRRDI